MLLSGFAAAMAVLSLTNFAFSYLIRQAVDAIKTMNIVKEESCAILENMNEAIICDVDHEPTLNYCNKNCLQIFKAIYQKCANDGILVPDFEALEQYFNEKKQFIRSGYNSAYASIENSILNAKVF